ncbi:hypothetical protein D3C79_1086090 [compost metagenome]
MLVMSQYNITDKRVVIRQPSVPATRRGYVKEYVGAWINSRLSSNSKAYAPFFETRAKKRLKL